MRFLSQNLDIYTFNSTIPGFNARNKLQLQKPSTKLPIYQKAIYYKNIKIFDKLPDYSAESVVRKISYIKREKVFN
jgi:hypothetical protein